MGSNLILPLLFWVHLRKVSSSAQCLLQRAAQIELAFVTLELRATLHFHLSCFPLRLLRWQRAFATPPFLCQKLLLFRARLALTTGLTNLQDFTQILPPLVLVDPSLDISLPQQLNLQLATLVELAMLVK